MGSFAALHSIVTGSQPPATSQQQPTKFKALRFNSINANIVQASEASNGFVYIIDNVLLAPEDPSLIVQTSATPGVSSSIYGAHNSLLLDFFNTVLASVYSAPGRDRYFDMNTSSFITIIATLTLAIAILLVLALVLIVRKRRLNKLANHHQQLESGLTSSSSANSGSTSTTKSL